jgi:hypothetical protein
MIKWLLMSTYHCLDRYFQLSRLPGENQRLLRPDDHSVFFAHAPLAGIQPEVADGDDYPVIHHRSQHIYS